MSCIAQRDICFRKVFLVEGNVFFLWIPLHLKKNVIISKRLVGCKLLSEQKEKETEMKKRIALGLMSVMLVSALTGCGKSNSKYLGDVDYSKYVTLSEYKGVDATKIVYDVTDADVQEEIEYNMYDYIEYDVITDRAATVGDYVNVTYTATIDGEVSEDFSGENEDFLIGEGYIYPEMEEALEGMETGETKTVDVELTEEYAEDDLIGKKASVEVVLNEISVEIMPEYNLDFVKENTEYETMEEYEASIKQYLLDYKEEEYKYVSVDEIFKTVIDNSKFDGYPEDLYTRCEEIYNSQNEYYASMYGMTLEEFEEMFGMDEETKKQEIEDSVHYELVIGAIAQEEGIDCTEQEVTEYIEEIYADYGYESAEEFLEDYTEEEVGYEVIYQKVADLLYENASFVEISEEDYLAEQEAYYMEEEDDSEEESGEVFEDVSGEATPLIDELDGETEESEEETAEEEEASAEEEATEE